ncbi:MAG: AAA family ATPase [Acidobacteria bacterium]|nr:AAA family ATPase [Acidobacteriota bacterium]
MYKKFFGLRENPFNVNPDPRYLCLNRHTQEALSCLTYGIQSRKGFILLTGEVGTGKTTLLNKLLDWLHRERVATAFLFNSRLNVTQFFDFMMADFGIPTDPKQKSQVLMKLNHWLLERYQAGETAVLVVDEAQNLSTQVLEEIRLLTNLETATDKLLQIVLSGQPELEYKLNQPQLRQLRQRITLRCKTHALSLEETGSYITNRLQIAGADGHEIFSPQAVETIHDYARGIPRVTNLLCEHSLISAFVDQQCPITGATVDEVAREFQLHEVEPNAQPIEEDEPSGENRRLMEALQSLVTLVDHLRRSDASPQTTRKGSYEPHSRSIKES